MFGSTAAVWSYCRTADLMTWLVVLCCWCQCCILWTTLGQLSRRAQWCPPLRARKACARHWGLSSSRPKANPQLASNECRASPSNALEAHPVPDWLRHLQNKLQEVLLEGRISASSAARRVGKPQFLLTSLFGRVGQVALRPLHKRAAATEHHGASKSLSLGTALREALEFLLGMLGNPKPRLLPKNPGSCTVIYADACIRIGEKGYKASTLDTEADLQPTCWSQAVNAWGFVVRREDSVQFAFGHVPHWFLRHFVSRRAYIHLRAGSSGPNPGP